MVNACIIKFVIHSITALRGHIFLLKKEDLSIELLPGIGWGKILAILLFEEPIQKWATCIHMHSTEITLCRTSAANHGNISLYFLVEKNKKLLISFNLVLTYCTKKMNHTLLFSSTPPLAHTCTHPIKKNNSKIHIPFL